MRAFLLSAIFAIIFVCGCSDDEVSDSITPQPGQISCPEGCYMVKVTALPDESEDELRAEVIDVSINDNLFNPVTGDMLLLRPTDGMKDVNIGSWHALLIDSCKLQTLQGKRCWEVYKIQHPKDFYNLKMDFVKRMLVGKWKQVRTGNIVIPDSIASEVEYKEDGSVTYCHRGMSYEEGSPDSVVVQSEYEFEDDWQWEDNFGTVSVMGHLSFVVWGRYGLFDGADRFLCTISGTELILLPDMGYYYYMDPTMYYVKMDE